MARGVFLPFSFLIRVCPERINIVNLYILLLPFTFDLDVRSQVVIILTEHGGVLESLQYNRLNFAARVYHTDSVGMFVCVLFKQENMLNS